MRDYILFPRVKVQETPLVLDIDRPTLDFRFGFSRAVSCGVHSWHSFEDLRGWMGYST